MNPLQIDETQSGLINSSAESLSPYRSQCPKLEMKTLALNFQSVYEPDQNPENASPKSEDSGIHEEKSPLQFSFAADLKARPFVCDVCSAAFTQKGNLTRHKHIHQDLRPYKCEICSYTSRRKDALINHQATHFVEKPYQCQECNDSYKQRASLRNHLKVQHGYTAQQINQMMPRNCVYSPSASAAPRSDRKRKSSAMDSPEASPARIQRTPSPMLDNSLDLTMEQPETRADESEGVILDLSIKSASQHPAEAPRTPSPAAPSGLDSAALLQQMYLAQVLRHRVTMLQMYQQQQPAASELLESPSAASSSEPKLGMETQPAAVNPLQCSLCSHCSPDHLSFYLHMVQGHHSS